MVAKTTEVKLYPTPENNSKKDDPVVSLHWVLGYFQQLQQQVPVEFQRSIEVRNWDKISLWYIKTLTRKEVLENARTEAIASLQEAQMNGTGLTPSQVTALLATLTSTD